MLDMLLTSSRRVGPYKLDRCLGVGGMGEVWLARRRALGGAEKNVALKMIRPTRGDAHSTSLFLQEARVSMLMSHPNVVQAFDAGRARGRCYLAMEWVDGVSLFALITELQKRGRRVSYGVAAHVVRSLLRGLSHVHAVPRPGRRPVCVVHSDVSPHNVLVSTRGEVKLADFGVAAVPGRQDGGVVGGKPRYMAPEQRGGADPDPRSDVFGVGAILHELLSGRRFREALGGAVSSETAIPALSDPNVPQDLRDLRLALLEPDPHKRPTAEEALRLLERHPPEPDAADELGRMCCRLRFGSNRPKEAAPSRGEVTQDEGCADTTRTWALASPGLLASQWRRPDPRSFFFGVLAALVCVIASVLAVALAAS